MAIITEIRRQKRRKERVSVFLDGDFWTGMTNNCFLDLGLHSGQHLDEEQVKEIEKKVVFDSGLSYALERLSYGLLSEKRLRDKLTEREYGEAVIDQVVIQCRELSMIDDDYLAQLLAVERRDRGQGRKRVEQYLKEKGLPRQSIDTALDDAFDPEEEYKLAEKSMISRFGEGQLDRRQQQRAQSFLLRRGFSGAVSSAIVAAQALSEEDESALHGPVEAAELLRRKYRLPLGSDDRRKAYGFLARRGFTSSVIKQTFDIIQE